MDEQLKLLEELQQVDIELHETETSLETLPAKLQEMKDDVARVETMLEEERSRLHEAQTYKADLERELKGEQELLQQTKSKMVQVRTSKEYLAIQREFESGRRHTGEREEEVVKLMEAVDQFQKSIATHEKELEELKEHVAQEEAETKSQIDKLTAVAQKQRGRREQMATEIRRDVLRKYDTIRRRRGGLAVVPAQRGVCTGCNMQVPPQLFNIIQRANSIEQCPACQRIIFFQPPPSTETEQSDDGK